MFFLNIVECFNEPNTEKPILLFAFVTKIIRYTPFRMSDLNRSVTQNSTRKLAAQFENHRT